MRNDSIETLLLRHYGSAAPAPVDLESDLKAMVRTQVRAELSRQQQVNAWNARRVSRRRVLQLVTFTNPGVGVRTPRVQSPRGNPKPALSM